MTAAVRKLQRRRDPARVGERVLAALDRGRERHNAERRARADALVRAVERLALDAIARGRRPDSIVISRRLAGITGSSPRNVRRILAALSSVAAARS